MLYDTGARVQELVDLTAGDVRLDPPPQVRLMGKGRKMRAVPLMDPTAEIKGFRPQPDIADLCTSVMLIDIITRQGEGHAPSAI